MIKSRRKKKIKPESSGDRKQEKLRIAEDRSSRKNTSFRFFFPKYFTTDRKVLISVQSGGIFIGLLRISSFFDRKQKQKYKTKKK